MKTARLESAKIVVPQRYKDFVVRRQYHWSGYIFAGVYGGISLAYYLLCIAFHYRWRFHFQGDILLPIMGFVAYILEVRKPWRYEINERLIKLFVVNPRFQLANLKEVHWAITEIVGIEHEEWQGLPSLKLRVLPDLGQTYLLVYCEADREEVETKILPMIEKYRHQYRQPLQADKLRL